MPDLPKRPCGHPGCSALITSGSRCGKHKKQERQQSDERRESSTQRGYGYKWQQARAAFLRAHPLCQCDECQEGRKRLKLATVVDHRIPHKGDYALFWDSSNWQAMAAECHNKKTAAEDGGFGNHQASKNRNQAGKS